MLVEIVNIYISQSYLDFSATVSVGRRVK